MLPDRLGQYRVRFRCGLFIRFRLLSTLSVENAVTINYGEVTTSPIRTFTRLFNRLHRRTSDPIHAVLSPDKSGHYKQGLTLYNAYDEKRLELQDFQGQKSCTDIVG
jgi:hypothetical protein